MFKKVLRIVLIVVFLTVALVEVQACDTWVAMQDATMDGSIILGKNSDRPPMEAQPLVHYASKNYGSGKEVKCTYIEIPQAKVTYENIGSKIWWTYGYEIGMNAHGVAIGNEAAWSKEPYNWNDGLLGMDLLRLALERGKTAYEAMHVIIDLIEEYGQSGDCEYPGEWGKANYHNTYIIADPNTAWVLETAGNYWAAKKLTHGVYSISNIYSIEQDWDEAHPNLVKHAIDEGWCESEEEFNFARDYGSYWEKGTPNASDMQIRRNATMACLKADYGKITPATMMKINRSHHEGTIVEPRWGAAETFFATPCMHDNAKSGYHSAAGMVAHLRSWMPPMLRQVYWACFSNPCVNVFQPFYFNGPMVPDNYAKGTSDYTDDSPWWWGNRVKLLADLNYRAVAPAIRGVFDVTEEWLFQRQSVYEGKALKLIEDGKEREAAKVLQKFIDENAERVEREYKTLNKTLPDIIKGAGVKYLFVDYMKDWTSKKGVPLPIK